MARMQFGTVDAGMRPSEVFARRLREVRKQRGLSQTELAERVTDAGVRLSKPALLRIEKGVPVEKGGRGLSLDEAIILAAVLWSPPAGLLTPPEGTMLALTNGLAVDGGGLRNWLLTGNPVLAWPDAPSDEDRATLDAILERDVSRYAQALIDATRAHDHDGKRVLLDAIIGAVDRHRDALKQIEERGSDAS